MAVPKGDNIWPNGAQAAAAFSFDFDAEEVWIGEDPENATKPGVLSQGTYGAKVAVQLILELLARYDLLATFFVPGKVAEAHPGRVEEIVAAGHEIGHHGYTHTSPTKLSRLQEEEELVKGKEVLEGFGVEVTGYRSPSWDLSPHTLTLLEAHGFAYSSNLMDDIRPYRHPGSKLVEVPIHWILDDAAHFWFDGATWTKKISTTGEIRALWEQEFLGIRRLGGACTITMHPQIIGRPGRLDFLDQFICFVLSHEDTWVTSCRSIASRVA